MMKEKSVPYEIMSKGSAGVDMFVIPYDSNQIFMEALKEECIFRNVGTSITTVDSDLDIWLSDSDVPAEWVVSNTDRFIKDAASSFTKKKMKCHKLAIIDRMDMDFMQDNADSFLQLVKTYTDIKELNAEIIRTFIEKVYVYGNEKPWDKSTKKIKVIFNFIGEVHIPSNVKTA